MANENINHCIWQGVRKKNVPRKRVGVASFTTLRRFGGRVGGSGGRRQGAPSVFLAGRNH